MVVGFIFLFIVKKLVFTLETSLRSVGKFLAKVQI